ncbi:MAG: hypothetical protein NC203_04875 [Firmicutes bacterium]|nr:hypothetical protein [[Eubacterium] siraeum]MCM1487683.1 hypothetical protein [Bacillota bacterium]
MKLFLTRSKQENFEGIRTEYLTLRKKFAVSSAVSAFTTFNFFLWTPEALAMIFSPLVRFRPMMDYIIIVASCTVMLVFFVLGFTAIQLGDKAEQLYRNLYPPVPTIKAYEAMKREGYVLHGEEELFETLGEKDSTDENLNLDIFGEGDSELMEYVGGGKSRSREEAKVPASKPDDIKLTACPLCGSLNPAAAESCDFCGAELHGGGENDEVFEASDDFNGSESEEKTEEK